VLAAASWTFSAEAATRRCARSIDFRAQAILVTVFWLDQAISLLLSSFNLNQTLVKTIFGKFHERLTYLNRFNARLHLLHKVRRSDCGSTSWGSATHFNSALN
jgi:hypothetical protein